MISTEQLEQGKRVKCFWSGRASKATAKYGTVAKRDDAGVITQVHRLRDVMIVQFRTDDNRDLCCHVQDLRGQ